MAATVSAGVNDTPYYTAPGVLTVDLDAVASNYRFFKNTVGHDCAVAGIVKADAYGLGMAAVAPVLEGEGCRQFFVATLEEGIALRSVTKQRICVLGGFWHGAEREYNTYDLIPALNSLDDIARWRAQASWIGVALPGIIHFDTGMNRLGLGRDETRELLAGTGLLHGINVQMVMSHFVAADEACHPLTARQGIIFGAIAKHFPGAVKSLANSSGILRDDGAWRYDMVRPGMAVYGLNPTPETKNPMTPAVALSVRLLQVRDAAKDETVGYGAAHALQKDSRVGTVALGYADGFLRSAGDRGTLYYNGLPCPILGRVSMDLVTVDLGRTGAQPGDRLDVLCPQQDADALAASMGTIGYEVLTGLGRRWGRHYITPRKPLPRV
jgi:alanine racemase